MSIRVRDLLSQQLAALRHEPIDKRIRRAAGAAGDAVVAALSAGERQR